MSRVLVRITTSFGACGGVVVGERAAPIFAYMRSWGLGRIQDYCARRGWACDVLGDAS